MKTASILTVIGATLLLRTPALSQSKDLSRADESMRQQIISQERKGLDALKEGKVELFGHLTADDAILIDAHGPAAKEQVLKKVAEFKLTDYSMIDMQYRALSHESGLIAYKVSEKGASHGKEFTAQAYVSSIWTKRNGSWVCMFSQETAVR